MRRFYIALVLFAGTALGELQPDTSTAFARYSEAVEQQHAAYAKTGRELWIDSSPYLKREVIAGRTIARPIAEILPDLSSRIPAADIHHTVGETFIPGATLEAVKAVISDYDDFGKIYGPDVVFAKLLARTGKEDEILIRVRKHFIITVVLNMKMNATWSHPDPGHEQETSVATYIGEAKDAANPDAGDRAQKEERGFLWKYRSFWRLEQLSEGVLVEHEIVAISRRVPAPLKILLRPMLEKLPQESMMVAVNRTKQAVLDREKGQAALSAARR